MQHAAIENAVGHVVRTEYEPEKMEQAKTALRELDTKVKQRLADGTIRLLDVDALLAQPSVWRISARQALERDEPQMLLSPAAATLLLETGDRRIFVLSYGWLSRGAPDPYGHRQMVVLRALRHFRSNNQLPAGCGLFWDFPALPQHLPDRKRSQAEDAVFAEALAAMADLYCSPLGTTVLVIKEM